jgi:hypothetical protein
MSITGNKFKLSQYALYGPDLRACELDMDCEAHRIRMVRNAAPVRSGSATAKANQDIRHACIALEILGESSATLLEILTDCESLPKLLFGTTGRSPTEPKFHKLTNGPAYFT